MNNRHAQERLGEIRKNNNGLLMEIFEYNGRHDIFVKFQTGEPVKTSYGNFLKGKVKNPYERSIYGIGYLGQGKYKAYINSRTKTPQYAAWRAMLQRCYGATVKETYKEVTLCDEWLNFQNFASWYDDNFYQVENKKMNLDKDILKKGNKLYSPDTCIFVPYFINLLFIKCDSSRGEFPIGVTKEKRTNKFVAGSSYYLGTFNTPEEAFTAYKTHKEKSIKEIAEQWKNKIPDKLYKALLNYQVDITD